MRLTPTGKMHAKEKAEENNIDQSMAFGSPRKRTQETSGLVMSGKLEEITGTETLEELKEKLDKDLPLKSGSKIMVDDRLNFEADLTSVYAKKALDSAKNGKYLKFLVEDSDRLAKEENDDKSSTYSKQAQAIASIVGKYYNIAPRFNELAQDKDKNYENTMKSISNNLEDFDNKEQDIKSLIDQVDQEASRHNLVLEEESVGGADFASKFTIYKKGEGKMTKF